MTIQMVRDESDGVVRIKSDQPLELNSTVTVVNLKGEPVQRFIVSLHSQFRNEYIYGFARNRESWLEKESARREKLEEQRSARRRSGYSRS